MYRVRITGSGDIAPHGPQVPSAGEVVRERRREERGEKVTLGHQMVCYVETVHSINN